MNEKIQVSVKKGRLLILLAAFLVIFALLALGFAEKSLFFKDESASLKRINSVVEKSQNLSDDPQARRDFLKDAVSELLDIAESSGNVPVKSLAYLNAALLRIGNFERLVKEKENEKSDVPYLLTRPSSVDLDNAIVHLQEAAKICAIQDNKEECFLGEIQEKLDYALALSDEYLKQGILNDEEDKDMPNSDNASELADKESAAKKSDDKSFSDVEAAQEFEEDKEARELSQVPVRGRGSIRGMLSEEEEEWDYIDVKPGGGYKEPVNKP